MDSAYHIEQGALAGTIATNEGDHLSLLDVESHTAQHLNVSVVGRYVLNT